MVSMQLLQYAIPDPQSTDYFHDGISIKEMTEIVPKHCKSLVKLICTEDLSQKKLAEKLGVSRPCISRRCKAIREALIAAGYIEVYILECDKENDPENFPGE